MPFSENCEYKKYVWVKYCFKVSWPILTNETLLVHFGNEALRLSHRKIQFSSHRCATLALAIATVA